MKDVHVTQLKYPSQRAGFIYAVSAYMLWGMFPAYFLMLVPATAWEIVPFRIIFALVFCLITIVLTRTVRVFTDIIRNRRAFLLLGLAGFLIYVNWQVYIIATTSGRIVEASLGYFINPVLTIVLGVIVFRERLRMLQWMAVFITAIACVMLIIAYGGVPWIAFVLAISFGLYALVKKMLGKAVPALVGLTVETLWITPIALVQLFVVASTMGLTWSSEGAWHSIALAGSGVVTAIPLLLFAAASTRLPLAYLGFIQYLGPILQMLFAILVMNEEMSLQRWIGFGILWLALLVLSVDLVYSRRRRVESTKGP